VVQAVCCALLENHEKCGTPFIFAANGSRLRVYSPEKCATRQNTLNERCHLAAGINPRMTRPKTLKHNSP
jgi:hypothetical protein